MIKTKILPLGIGTLMALVVVLGTITPMIAAGAPSAQISASMTVVSPTTIGITVSTTSINFGNMFPGQGLTSQVTVTNTGTVPEAISASAPNWALSGGGTIPITSMTAQLPGTAAVTMSNQPVALGTLPVSPQAVQLAFVESVPSNAQLGPYSTMITLTAQQG